jgi:predicted dehydrogenase
MINKKICIIGFGEMGKRHARDMHEHSNGKVKIAAVYEPDEQNYQEGAKWLGYIPERFTSITEMLDKINPDGVIIASPNHTHWDALQYFENKNIPLIIEKPLDSTYDKLLKIVNFTEKYAAPIMVHHVMRYAPIIKKAKTLISEGTLGNLCSFRFALNEGGGHMHNFRRNKRSGGGQMLEKATHDLDIMLHLMNSSPKRVIAICKQQVYGGNKSDTLCCSNCAEKISCAMYTEIGENKTGSIKDINVSQDLCAYAKSADIPDNEICIIELENGIFGSQTNTFFIEQYYTRVYEIIGDSAVMRISLTVLPYEVKNHYQGKLEIFPRHGKVKRFNFEYENRIHYNGSPGVFKHFYGLMCGKTKKVISPVDEAFAAEMIAIAAYRSNEQGEYVAIKDILPDNLKASFDNPYSFQEVISPAKR